jgi:hypothetical protein
LLGILFVTKNCEIEIANRVRKNRIEIANRNRVRKNRIEIEFEKIELEKIELVRVST